MFNLELSQRWMLNPELQEIVPDPAASARLDDKTLRRFMEALIEDDGASLALRKHVAARYPVAAGQLRAAHEALEGGRPRSAAGLRRAARRQRPAVPPRPRLRRGPEPLGAARHRRHQRGDAQGALGDSEEAEAQGAGRRVPRRRRHGRRGQALRPRRPRRPAAARAGRLGARRGQPAVPPADGLRRGHEDHRPLRARARSPRPLAPAAESRRTRTTTAASSVN